jgi:hypothetical protein
MKHLFVKFIFALCLGAGVFWWGWQQNIVETSGLAERAAARFSARP